jgi:endonuclease YncB( thermonuclease family)
MTRFATIALAVLAVASATAARAPTVTVTDGDSIKVNGERWRLLGYDCPETYQAKCESEYKLGIVATARLQKLIDTAKKIETVTDGRRDRYRRILGRLIIDGRDVMLPMTADGLCVPYVCGAHRCPRRRSWCAR